MTVKTRVINYSDRLKIVDFQSAIHFLYHNLTDTRSRLFNANIGLQRTHTLLKELGNPQENYPSIHIAGTSGKGSTAYMTSTLLTIHNKNTGTVTSPHVYDIRERLMLNNAFISENEFTQLVTDLFNPIIKLQQSDFGRPTYFEVMIGLAHRCFANHNIDYGVIETGIGGKFDSTNTINREDKLAVITRLGFDHTEILGDSISKIAEQKAGIIPINGHAIALLPDDKSAQVAIESEASKKNATLQFIDPKKSILNLQQTINGIKFDYLSDNITINNIFIPILGKYQAENACLAIATLEFLSKRDNFRLDYQKIRKGFMNAKIPARAEIMRINNTPVIIDSAHNPQKLEALFGLITSLKLPIKPLVVFSVKSTKDWQSSTSIVSKHSAKVFATRFFDNQPNHLQKLSTNPEDIAQQIIASGGDVTICNNPISALDMAFKESRPNQTILITGSMYMLSELHDHLIKLSSR